MTSSPGVGDLGGSRDGWIIRSAGDAVADGSVVRRPCGSDIGLATVVGSVGESTSVFGIATG